MKSYDVCPLCGCVSLSEINFWTDKIGTYICENCGAIICPECGCSMQTFDDINGNHYHYCLNCDYVDYPIEKEG